jgi:opacity protein-like surface antigen
MKRISLIITILCLPLILCGQVKAQHYGPYVGGFLGGDFLMSARSSDSQGSFTLKFDPGFQGSAVAGWDFKPNNPIGEGRIELEYTHRSNPFNKGNFFEGDFNGSGKMIADSLLCNFIGLLRDKSPWAPYLELGLGAARLETSDFKIANVPFSSDSSVVFAYQVGTGIDFAVTDNVSLDLGYRFFSTTNPRFNEANGRKFEMSYFNHSAILGVRVGF